MRQTIDRKKAPTRPSTLYPGDENGGAARNNTHRPHSGNRNGARIVKAIDTRVTRCYSDNGSSPIERGVAMNYERELLKGNTDSLLLCLISHQPTYGYQIVKELEKRSNGYFQFKEGTLYPALHRLEKDNLITGKWQILPNGQQRRYYYITERGQQVLARKLATWQDFSTAVKSVIQPETT